MAVDHDLGFPVEDHVERRAGDALPENPGPGGMDLFLEDMDDPVQLWRREVREEREARDLVDDLVAAGHGDGILRWARGCRILPPGGRPDVATRHEVIGGIRKAARRPRESGPRGGASLRFDA